MKTSKQNGKNEKEEEGAALVEPNREKKEKRKIESNCSFKSVIKPN